MNIFTFKKILLLLASLPLFLAAQQPGPIIRAEIKPKGEVLIGEAVILDVDILVPTWFSRAPQFPNITVDNAIALPPERSMNLSEQINGKGYAGIRHEYKIIPQLPGSYHIPSIEVSFYYALENAQPSALTTLKTQPFTFTAELPPEARGLSYFIAATGMTVGQKLTPRTDTLRVGEALERRLTFRVYDALAMVIPPLSFDSIPGLAVYPRQPIVEDFGGERGSQRVGQRVESATYLIQDSGSYTLPAVELFWWNLKRKRLQTARIPAVRFYAKAAPARAPLFPLVQDTLLSESDREGTKNYSKIFYWLLAATALVLLTYRLNRRYGPGLNRRYAEIKHKRREAEKTYFRRLSKACWQNRPGETVQALLAWLEKIGLDGGMSRLFAETVDRQIIAEVQNLLKHLYASEHAGAGWQGHRLYRALKRFRKEHLKKKKSLCQTALPPLNPL